MEDAPSLLRIAKSECPDIWIRLPRHKWPKSWANIEDSVVLLERNLYGDPLAGLVWERHFEEVLLGLGWEKVPNWNVCSFIETEHGSHVEEIEKKNLDLDEPTETTEGETFDLV